MTTAILLWVLGIGYLAIGIVRLSQNGLMTQGSPRELVIDLVMVFLYAGAGVLVKRTAARFSYSTDSPAVVIFKSLVFTALWLEAGAMIFMTQLIVY